MVSFFKYRQCLITAPVVLTRIYALVHQVRVYAFGAPTTCLRVWCTSEALTNQGKDASVYRPCSLLQYERQSPSKQAYDTTCISCLWIRLTCTIKLVQTLINLILSPRYTKKKTILSILKLGKVPI